MNTLVGDRLNKNYEIHIFNSDTLFQLSYSAALKSRVYPTLDWASFRSHLFFRHLSSRSAVLAYISLIRSFFCPGISQTLRSHHTTLYSHSRHTHLSIQTSCIFTHLWQPLPQKVRMASRVTSIFLEKSSKYLL